MLRDDIRDKVIELLHKEFEWLSGEDYIKSEHETLDALAISVSDIRDFTETIIVEFELEEIELSEVMKWTTVKDIVNYIEVALQNKAQQEEETQIPMSERW